VLWYYRVKDYCKAGLEGKRLTLDVESNAKRSGRRSGGWKAPGRNKAVLCQSVEMGELLDKGGKGEEHSKLPPPRPFLFSSLPFTGEDGRR